MVTVVNDKKMGPLAFTTQQYVTGLYLAVYQNGKSMPITQTGLKVFDEVKFHKDLRKDNDWDKDNSSVLECDNNDN